MKTLPYLFAFSSQLLGLFETTLWSRETDQDGGHLGSWFWPRDLPAESSQGCVDVTVGTHGAKLHCVFLSSTVYYVSLLGSWINLWACLVKKTISQGLIDNEMWVMKKVSHAPHAYFIVLYEEGKSKHSNLNHREHLSEAESYVWVDIYFIACACRLFRWLCHWCGQGCLSSWQPSRPLQTHQTCPGHFHMGATRLGRRNRREEREQTSQILLLSFIKSCCHPAVENFLAIIFELIWAVSLWR